MKKIIFLFTALTITLISNAQLSNKHWLPPLHANESQDGLLIKQHYVYLSTPEPTPFQVTITDGAGIPIAGSPFTISQGNPVRVTIGTDQPSKMMLDRIDVGHVVSGKGLILEGQYDFYVNFRVRADNHAEFLASKGRTGAGNIFRLGSLPQNDFGTIRNFVSSFMATEDNTTVNLSDYDSHISFIDGNTNFSTATQTFTLNKGESVVISGYTDGSSANLDGFVGALLESDKPIVVNTGNLAGGMSSASNGQDFNLDQIVPLAQVGQEYVIMKGNGSDLTEHPLVIAHEDNTDVFVNGNATPITTLNAGEYFLIPTSNFIGPGTNKNMYINTSKKAFLYQIVGGSISDATSGFYFIPPLSCFWQNSVDLIPAINEIGTQTDFTGNLIIATETGSTITINGVPTTSTPLTVTGNSNWETYRVNNLSGNVTIESTGALAVGLFSASGFAGIGGYFSGFGSIPSDTTIDVCTGGIIDLFDKIPGNPEIGGTWEFNGTPRVPNNGLFDPSTDLIGTYTYTFTKFCDGVTRIIPIDIVINSIQQGPHVGSSASISFCDNDAVIDLTTLLGSGITTGGKWSYNGVSIANGIFDPANSQAGNYTYSFPANGVCDPVSATVTVTVNQSPEILNTIPYELCDGNVDGDDTNGFVRFTLNSQNTQIIGTRTDITSVKYYEFLSDAQNDINALPNIYYSNSKTIYYRITNSNNCYSIAPLDLIVNTLPTLLNTTITLRQCDDDTDTLADFILSEANDLITSDSNVNFSYHLSYTGAVNNNAIITNSNQHHAANGSSVWVRVENQFGCYRVAQINLVVSTTQFPASFVPLDYEQCDIYRDVTDPANDGYDYFDIDSFYTNTIISAFPVSQQPYLVVSYYENYIDAELIQNSIPDITNYRNIVAGGNSIWARVDSQLNTDSGCKGIQELQLIVNPLPNTDLGVNFVLCLDPVTGLGSQIVDATPQTTGNYSYVWTSDIVGLDLSTITTSQYNIEQAGTYTVTVTNTNTGCEFTDEIITTFSSGPASFTAEVITPQFSSGTTTIIGDATGGYGVYEYSLDLVNWQLSPTFTGLPNGTYTIYVRDIQNCGSLSVTNLVAITYPNFFTPNGDGYNDKWNISGLPLNFNGKISIFDRYGKLIKEIYSDGNGWDGTYGGKLMPSTDYWFVLEYTQDNVKKEFKSHFSLKR
ncbi:T9SS type B sorting domain-containing protein [Flavobacterium haoranii]|uniref:Gliding motility-associated C-terminal domain-containing protein n=1 Tax=Flavobacterium haoranii TaxID=683124 RepID=A0A1M6DU76_9FLAO|nr:T9SS type B sorting domain-containing protein [Flavobacterium haoranii]SHI76804.1 gliding motility-associated C-terminal domain-containing protein [Flavobacterium haoranii]